MNLDYFSIWIDPTLAVPNARPGTSPPRRPSRPSGLAPAVPRGPSRPPAGGRPPGCPRAERPTDTSRSPGNGDVQPDVAGPCQERHERLPHGGRQQVEVVGHDPDVGTARPAAR